MANTIKVLFWLHRHKVNKDGLVPLVLRLTFQKQMQNKATGYYINPNIWNVSKQRLKGNSEASKEINTWIESTIVKVNSRFRDFDKNNPVHLPSLMSFLFTEVSIEPTLLQTISEHNLEIKARVKNDFSYSTYEKYVFTLNKVQAFIENVLKRKDILLSEITTKFIMDFDHYLRVHDKNMHNTAVKYCLNLKRILNVAVMKGLLAANPFKTYKTIYKDTPQVYLSEEEVGLIENVALVKTQHILAKDLFLFQCNTGLAYTDMISLSQEDISVDTKGGKWIIKPRQKSGIISTIPLLKIATGIIDKYSNDPRRKNKLFPHYSIQKYNQYIGEVGLLAGITKKLSSHVGRRTFGNIGLAKGLSLNVISKILGHANTLITQRIYAITTQNIISQEIEKW